MANAYTELVSIFGGPSSKPEPEVQQQSLPTSRTLLSLQDPFRDSIKVDSDDAQVIKDNVASTRRTTVDDGKTLPPDVRYSSLGPYLRLVPLKSSYLPHHPDLLAVSTSRPPLEYVVKKLISEAYNLRTEKIVSQYRPTWKNVKRFRAANNTRIDVEKTKISRQLIHEVNVHKTPVDENARDWMQYARDGLEGSEKWFSRRSTHEDRDVKGTASWDEFLSGLRNSHSENEKLYTPDVVAAKIVLDYEKQLEEAGLSQKIQGLSLRVVEMVHKLPFPLNNRVFPVLVLTASINPNEFVVASASVDIATEKFAFFSTNKHRSPAIRRNLAPDQQRRTTVGSYASAECVVRQPNEKEKKHWPGTQGHEIVWTMVTTSDAGGRLPLWLQRPVIPRKIVQDVPLFMRWTHKKRIDPITQ